jgi:predicted acetyltransferase
MSVKMKWVGKEASEVVGRVRALSYAPAMKEVAVYQERLAGDARITGDDLLLAEKDGVAVGTTTSYSMSMWVRGTPVPCQGVAFVGTVKTHRRAGGIASELMRETLRKGRERGQVVSALMPFRASFYEHFGYGLVERRNRWRIPLAVLPHGDAAGFGIVEGGADEARRACRQRMVEAGQCDIERSPGVWEHWTKQEGDGYVAADRDAAGRVRSWVSWEEYREGDKDWIRVFDCAYESEEALARMLHFFASLRDQFRGMTISLPVDLPLNWFLRETQVPHRAVNHEAAELSQVTRMQVRVLDHRRLIEAMKLPGGVRGGCTVAIAESEGASTRLQIDVEGGRAQVKPVTGDCDVELTDRIWAAVVLGDLKASDAAGLGLIKVNQSSALAVLEVFSQGRAPFCNEYF